MIIKSRYLRLLLVLMALNLSAVSVFGQSPQNHPKGSQKIETSLASEYYYNIPQNVPVLEWFQKLTEALEKDLVFHPEHAAQTQVLLGDAYHWIGHIYEDRGDYKLAWRAHNKSYNHYILSSIKTSPAINNLGTVAHARFHIKRVAEELNRSVPLGLSNEPQITDQSNSTDEEMVQYRQEIEKAWQRASPGTKPVSCRLFF